MESKFNRRKKGKWGEKLARNREKEGSRGSE